VPTPIQTRARSVEMGAVNSAAPDGVRGRFLIGSVGCGAATFVGLWFGYQHWQFALWLLSLALVVAAFPGRAGEPPAAHQPWTRSEAALFAAIVLLGAFFRLYRLGSLPPGLWVDETYVSTRAAELMNHKPFLPFSCSPLTSSNGYRRAISTCTRSSCSTKRSGSTTGPSS